MRPEIPSREGMMNETDHAHKHDHICHNAIYIAWFKNTEVQHNSIFFRLQDQLDTKPMFPNEFSWHIY